MRCAVAGCGLEWEHHGGLRHDFKSTPAPEPPPVGDDAEEAAQEWIDTYGIPDSVEAVADLIRTKEAAGRARGEANMRKRCERIVRAAADNEERGYASWASVRNLADAIAKEGTK